jgi:hypothetical protein
MPVEVSGLSELPRSATVLRGRQLEQAREVAEERAARTA